ncbi:MAG: hypothetical protein WD794_07890, partial [Mycobacteriales bacterium]
LMSQRLPLRAHLDVSHQGIVMGSDTGGGGMTRQVRLRSSGRGRAARFAGRAALLGGVAWLALIPAAELHRRDLLGYDGYNRLLVVPLLLFALAMWQAPRAGLANGGLARVGFTAAAVGAAVLAAGNVIEFYGVLFQDGLNAYAASQADVDEHWIGSDIGWIVFGIGMLVLLVGGVVAALGLRHRKQRWLVAFTAALGLGVLGGNLFGLAPALVSVPVLALYAAGWTAFGRHLLLQAPSVASGAAPTV